MPWHAECHERPRTYMIFLFLLLTLPMLLFRLSFRHGIRLYANIEYKKKKKKSGCYRPVTQLILYLLFLIYLFMIYLFMIYPLRLFLSPFPHQIIPSFRRPISSFLPHVLSQTHSYVL